MALEASIIDELQVRFGPTNLLVGDRITENYRKDESIGTTPCAPLCVVFPESTEDVSAVLSIASQYSVPVVPRGAGTGLSGGALPKAGSLVLSTERMNAILELNRQDSTVRVQAGVTLSQLDEYLMPLGYVYPVYPGELGSTIGGNVATNAGGMRAVKYGVTRHQVLGLTFVLADGTVMHSGGSYVKSSSGYDLTQLVIGSEGTLAVACEATLRVYLRPPFTQTILAPFAARDHVWAAVRGILAVPEPPMILEYVDGAGLHAMAAQSGLELGIPQGVKDSAAVYLIVVLEAFAEAVCDEQAEIAAACLEDAGSLGQYFLNVRQGELLITARESAFWLAKSAGADEIIDVVVPRSSIGQLMDEVASIGERTGSWISAAGHVGDGNIHFSLFQPDSTLKGEVMMAIYIAAGNLGGEVSAEHGIGSVKVPYYIATSDEAKLELMKSIKSAFDPAGILNPGKIFG